MKRCTILLAILAVVAVGVTLGAADRPASGSSFARLLTDREMSGIRGAGMVCPECTINGQVRTDGQCVYQGPGAAQGFTNDCDDTGCIVNGINMQPVPKCTDPTVDYLGGWRYVWTAPQVDWWWTLYNFGTDNEQVPGCTITYDCVTGARKADMNCDQPNSRNCEPVH